MQLTSVENDDGSVEYVSDQETVGGSQLIIVVTPSGLFKIEARGPGATPSEIENERFTSKRYAEEALKRFVSLISPKVAKKKIHLEAIKRRQAENGERPTE